MYKFLAVISLILCFVVVTFGAYVRLTDAGLGCPDWPGCYGELTPKQAADDIAAAVAQNPTGPVTMQKAWNEMNHRYIAGILGILILVMALLSWFNRQPREIPRWFPTLLGCVVVMQALFGKWTVTLLLKPAIVTGHLIGGMLIFTLLAWQVVRLFGSKKQANFRLRSLATVAALAVAMQIALGGWVSTNYAALACTDFPKCHGQWKPENMDFEHGFTIARPLGKTKAGDALSRESLDAIHWTHRVGALLVTLIVGALGVALWRNRLWKGAGFAVLFLLAAQVGLGVANIWLSLPLLLAVAHNGGAALLIAKLVTLRARMRA
jgi:cytochrome c oxidase assembly protein subunit 15